MTQSKKNQLRDFKEEAIRFFFFSCAFLSIITTFGIVAVLLTEGMHFFREVSLVEFFFGTTWAPLFVPKFFGVLPLVAGTLQIAIGSAIVAIPLGLGCAIFLSEYASPNARLVLKPILEILAGVPTVVYGFFAIQTVTPFLQWLMPQTEFFNAASGAIVVGIMVLPMIASLCDDSLRSLPRDLRYAAYAMGATKYEVCIQVLVPGAISGILSSFVLAFSRAIGETMAVTLASGATPKLTLNPLESIQTMTAYMVQVSMGDVEAGSVEYHTIFAVGLLLFTFTFTMNVFAHWVVKKFGRYKGVL